MTHQYQVAGPAILKVGTGVAGALETLGYTRDGVEMEFDGFFEELHSDDVCGEQGPPGDLNYLGERARIRIELTKWDGLIADKVTPRVLGTTAGVPATTATLLVQGTKYIRLLIEPRDGAPFNFVVAVPRGAITINKGSRHSRLVMEWEAYVNPSSGKLFDAVTT
jgi:hypothetical protein